MSDRYQECHPIFEELERDGVIYRLNSLVYEMKKIQHQIKYDKNLDVCDEDIMRKLASVELPIEEVVAEAGYRLLENPDGSWCWYENGDPKPFHELPKGYTLKKVEELTDTQREDLEDESDTLAVVDKWDDVIESGDDEQELLDAVWENHESIDLFDDEEEAAQDCLDSNRIERSEYDAEVYEHWLVADWFGRRLTDVGEQVVEAWGLTIWCRCVTGQAISMDGSIQRVAENMEILPGQQHHESGGWNNLLQGKPRHAN